MDPSDTAEKPSGLLRAYRGLKHEKLKNNVLIAISLLRAYRGLKPIIGDLQEIWRTCLLRAYRGLKLISL